MLNNAHMNGCDNHLCSPALISIFEDPSEPRKLYSHLSLYEILSDLVTSSSYLESLHLRLKQAQVLFLLQSRLFPLLPCLKTCDLWMFGVSIVLSIRRIDVNVMLSSRCALTITHWMLGMLLSTLFWLP